MNRTRQSVFLLLLSIAGMATGMAPRPVPPPVPMELVRAIQDTETGALAIEWVVPNVEKVGPLDRLELLILNEKGEVVFGAMQNLSDRCNPVPPEAFGVVLDPTSDERSIDNVASAGIQAQWDQESAGGTLLKQSVSGVHNGTLGIAFWIAPGDWKPNTYLIAVRAIRKNSQPEPWRNLTTLAVTGSQSAAAAPAERCQVQPLFTSRGG
ncbi:MAG: hypothetical protein RBT03_07340, partial [Kiritimatiellia bacterium]|nr:hypothetical protein [Kiritimatiellia bacterium]